jgi:CARDB
MTQRQLQGVVFGVITLFMYTAHCPRAARAQGPPSHGTWSRSKRAGGETWVYRFTVDGSAPAPAEGLSAGAEMPRGETHSGDVVGTSRSLERRPPAAMPADGGVGGSAGLEVVDINVTRAYVRTAAGGAGNEVAAPAVGQTVYFHVDFSVTGTTNAVSVSRRALIDGEDFCGSTESTTAGDYLAWCNTGWTATAGDHTLRWDFDYDNTVAESDETNNSATAMWTSSVVSADLVANRAFLKTMNGGDGDEVSTPAVGQTVFFYVDLTVAGPDSGVMVDRRALIDGEEFCNFTSTLQPGDYFSWCINGWTATAGSHTLRWDLDFNNAVAEDDENNNSVSTTFTSATCAGDCDGDNVVTVSELITMIDVALGNAPLASCNAGDTDGDGAITITDLVAGVDRALNGCG